MRHSSGTWSTLAFSSWRQRTSGCSFSRNSHTWPARARIPLTFQVAIFKALGALDDLELVVDAGHAVDLRSELRRLAPLGFGGDRAEEADAAAVRGDVDRARGQLGLRR